MQTLNLDRSYEDLREFYQSLKENYLMDEPSINNNRRKSDRIKVTIPVCVSHSDETGGIHQNGVSRDLSEHGIGLVMNNPVGRETVRLRIKPYMGSEFDVLAKVVHCKEDGFYYHVGFEFIVS